MIMLQQMAILFLVMMTGLLAKKQGIITSDSSKKLSGLVVNISNPCFILSSVIGGERGIQGKELLLTFGIAVGLYGFLLAAGLLMPHLLRAPRQEYGIYSAMTVFTNLGFMGFPIISGIYGEEALLYAAVFLLPFNVLIYTYGVFILRRDEKKQICEETGKTRRRKRFSLRRLINPGVGAALLALFIYYTRLPVLHVVTSAVRMIGHLTAPLSMMIIGASFAEMNLKDLFTDKKLLVFSWIKLCILPLAGMSVLRLFNINPVLQGICLIMLATPVASMVPMLANEYDADPRLAVKGVAVTSLLAVVTLPVVFLVTGL